VQLQGKVTLVTGGDSGIGLGTARRMVQEGASVIITGRKQDALNDAVNKIGANVRAIQADVTKKDDMARVAAAIREDHGHLDILFANAG